MISRVLNFFNFATQPKPTIYDLEAKVLKYSGLELNRDLFVYDVPIEMNNKTYKIHTYRCGDHNTEELVLLHGYAGTSALYYPMLKELSEKYKVYCIDFIGMGLSSKEKFECQNTDETLDFLVGSIEKWRQEVGIEKFHLAGHSFGGYISGQYAARYPDKVKKLSLLSPVGFTKHDQELTIEHILEKSGFWRKMFINYVMNAWKNGVTPHSFLHNNPTIGKYLIGRYLGRLFTKESEEAEHVKEFMIEMLNLPLGAEPAIHHILKPPRAAAHFPLEEFIENMKMPIDCYFGEHDYMDTTGAERVKNRGKKIDFAFKVVPGAAHQLTMQNPLNLAKQLIDGYQF